MIYPLSFPLIFMKTRNYHMNWHKKFLLHNQSLTQWDLENVPLNTKPVCCGMQHLPNHITNISNYELFKKALKRHNFNNFWKLNYCVIQFFFILVFKNCFCFNVLMLALIYFYAQSDTDFICFWISIVNISSIISL